MCDSAAMLHFLVAYARDTKSTSKKCYDKCTKSFKKIYLKLISDVPGFNIFVLFSS